MSGSSPSNEPYLAWLMPHIVHSLERDSNGWGAILYPQGHQSFVKSLSEIPLLHIENPSYGTVGILTLIDSFSSNLQVLSYLAIWEKFPCTALFNNRVALAGFEI